METARAQSAASTSTAMANNVMGMVNQVTPYGNLTYSQSGQQFIPGETGQTYWQGPNGEIRSSAPQSGSASPQIVGYKQVHTGYDDKTGDVWRQEPIYGDVSDGSAEGWSKVRGQYIPQYTATQSLTPAQQQMLDMQNQAGINLSQIAANQSGAIRDHLSSPMGLSGLTPYANIPQAINLDSQYSQIAGPGGINLDSQYSQIAGPEGIKLTDDYSADRQRYEDALMERLNQQAGTDRAAMEARLANQGIALGSRAYGAAEDDFGRGLTDARLGAILAAGQEQQRMQDLARNNALAEYGTALSSAGFNAGEQTRVGDSRRDDALAQFGTGLSSAQFAAGEQSRVGADRRADAETQFNSQVTAGNVQNARRGAETAEAFALRNQPINEITALLSGSQVQQPNFVSPPVSTMPTTDVAGLINNAYGQEAANYQSQMNNWNSIWGGLLGAGGTALGGWLAG